MYATVSDDKKIFITFVIKNMDRFFSPLSRFLDLTAFVVLKNKVVF